MDWCIASPDLLLLYPTIALSSHITIILMSSLKYQISNVKLQTSNCSVEYLSDNATASVVAMRDVAEGEEVCISYVSLEDFPDVESRKPHLLAQHCFECACELCLWQEEEAMNEAKEREREEREEGRAKKRKRRK